MVFTPRGSEFLVNTQTAGSQVDPAITQLANGGFVVVWDDPSATLGDSSGSSIKGRLYDASGAAAGTEFLINTQTVGNQLRPNVAGLNGGGFVVTWTDASGVSDGSFSGIEAQLFSAAGSKVGGEFLVNTQTFSTQASPDVVPLAGGGFLVTWFDLVGTSVKAQAYDGSGNRAGGEVTVDAGLSLGSASPKVAALGNGGFVITWEDGGAPGDGSGSAVEAQIFGPTGAKIGGEFLVNTSTTGAQGGSDIAVLSGGGFIITWVDVGTQGNIKAQLFDAAGTKVGTELLVNAQGAGHQNQPTVSALNDGGFVISWIDANNVTDVDIKAQLFDATATKIGTEFLVSTQTALNQNQPAVTKLADGLAVAWSDNSGTLGDNSGASIKAQLYQHAAGGASSDDSFTTSSGTQQFDGGLGLDTVSFDFRLTDATVRYAGNVVIIDGPSSHAVLTGIEVFKFADGTVNDNDADPLVDDLFYYSHNLDVWSAHADADTHFHATGWREGRDPDAFFSTSTYLSLNPAVKAQGIDPLVQFDQTGWKTGGAPSIFFDVQKYLAANPDVKAAGVDPLAHFLQFGAQEGRQASAPTEIITANGFDYVYYLQHNPDIAAAHVDPFQHFETVGWKEGRNPNALFDVNGYLATYADVRSAGLNPLDHYNQSGWQEGRDPSTAFDTTDYIAHNPDVAAAHVNPLTHYLASGLHEGRVGFNDGAWE